MDKENSNINPWDIRVTLLGTGSPMVSMDRYGPGTLVEVGGEILLFDAGRGVLQRLVQLQTPLKDLRSLFLTHLHSDHLVGLPDLWLTGWVVGSPESPLRLWGPRGTKGMMAHLNRAFDFDIRIRLYDERLPPQGIIVLVEEITEGVVYEHNGIKVTAFEADHSPIQPAFGYRIDYKNRAVLLSGDTRFSEHIIKCAQGVDVIVHEVIVAEMLRARTKNLQKTEQVIAHHTTAEQAGNVFTSVNPKLAVYNHIVPSWPGVENELILSTRKTYAGPLAVGEDLMVINIGDKVTIRTTSQQTT